MERDQIVELIKEGRLQEAIKALDKAAKNTHLQNDVINLSAAYADYVKHNRSATEDFETLNIQRSKITNSLLSILDELSPEDLEQATLTTSQTHIAQPSASILQNKRVLYGIIGVLLLIIAYFAFSSGSGDGSVTTNQQSFASVDDISNVRIVDYKRNDGSLGSFVKNESQWLENNQFTYTEEERKNGIIYLRDESRGCNVELDLGAKEIKISMAQDQTPQYLYNIEHFE